MTINGVTAAEDTPLASDGMLGILGIDGHVPPGYQSPLSDGELLAAHRLMVLTRTASQRAVSLQRQGRLGTFAPPDGQEAAMVGSVWALDPQRDWVVPQYRELPCMVRMGFPLARYLLYFRGHPLGNITPPGVNVLPVQISLASQLPHAVGLAWGVRQQGSDGVVVTYFGEGAASEGDAHEAMNLAGVRRAPVVFILQNNGWAISTPVTKQTAASSHARRAAGYGFPGEVVDGNDLFAVYEATRRAVQRARAGEGPTLIEAVTYRLGAHNTADDHTRYMDLDILDGWRARDPLTRFETYLTARALLTEDDRQRIAKEVTEEVAVAVTEMESEPEAGPEYLFSEVYAQLTPRLARQRTELTGEH